MMMLSCSSAWQALCLNQRKPAVAERRGASLRTALLGWETPLSYTHPLVGITTIANLRKQGERAARPRIW